jgi:protein-disulfide isomerase
MSSTNAGRRAKIEAARPKGGGGPNRVVVATVVGSQKKDTASGSGGSGLPAGASAMGKGIVVNPGAPSSVPTMDLYVDYQCPVCAAFERRFGQQVTQLADQNQVRLVVHTLSFLDDNLNNDSSLRAANAAACAADQGRFLPYHNAVFAGQPTKEGQGYTDAQLAEFATTAGISGAAKQSWQQCYDTREHNQYVQSVQTQSEKDGVNGTPTIKLNGRQVDLTTLTSAQALTDAVKAAGR